MDDLTDLFRRSARVLILGLGNPLLGDDGIGWQVAERVRALVASPDVEVDCLDQGGLNLMERLVGYEHAILIDAMITGAQPPGTVRVFRQSELTHPGTAHACSAHDVSLPHAMEMALSLGVAPSEPLFVTIEAQQVYEFTEHLSPDVASAVEPAVLSVLNALTWYLKQSGQDRPDP